MRKGLQNTQEIQLKILRLKIRSCIIIGSNEASLLEKAMKLYNNNHSVFALHYHLILVVKYRRKVINDTISKRLREMFENIGREYKITIEEWNHDNDHVHVLFRAEPKSELTHFINSYKSASSRLVKKEHPEIRKKLWEEMFWSRSFCLMTTGEAPLEIIQKYIEHQGEK